MTHDTCEKIASELAGKLYNKIRDIGELDLARTIAGERIKNQSFSPAGAAYQQPPTQISEANPDTKVGAVGSSASSQ